MAQLLPVNLGKRLAAAGWATAQIWANESGQLAAFSVAAPSKTAQLIKQLRERSGSPISDVKSCLEACNWDADAAYDALRKKGLAAAAKKSSRHASEGLVGCLAAPNGQVAGATSFCYRVPRHLPLCLCLYPCLCLQFHALSL